MQEVQRFNKVLKFIVLLGDVLLLNLLLWGFELTLGNRFYLTLSKILCKWKQDSVVSFFLYLDSVFKNKHKLIHNQSPVMNRLCPFLLNLHK